MTEVLKRLLDMQFHIAQAAYDTVARFLRVADALIKTLISRIYNTHEGLHDRKLSDAQMIHRDMKTHINIALTTPFLHPNHLPEMFEYR